MARPKRNKKSRGGLHPKAANRKLIDPTLDHPKTLKRKRKTNINDLPIEILQKIFSFLSIVERLKIEMVSKRWWDIGLGFGWKIGSAEIQRFLLNHALTDSRLKMILRRCGGSLTSLDLSQNNKNFSHRAADAVAEYCPNLESVNLSGVIVSNYGLRKLSNKCVKIKTAVFRENGFNDNGLWWLMEKCRELEHLDISKCKHIKGSCFGIINKNVKSLNFTGCDNLSKGLLKLINCSVEDLILNNCQSINNDIMEYLFQQFSTSLKKLELGGNLLHVNLETLSFSLLPNLEVFKARHSTQLRDVIVELLSQHCPLLSKIDISGTIITDTDLMPLTSCLHLVEVDLSFCYGIGNEIIKALAEQGKLERLIVQGSKIVTDDACDHLAKHCVKLIYLDLSSCPGITDVAVDSFVETIETGERILQLLFYAGGTSITYFVNIPELCVVNEDLCPPKFKPRYYFSDESYDDDDDDDVDYDDDLLL